MIDKDDNNNISISLTGPVINDKTLRNSTHIKVRAIALSVNFAQQTTQQPASETLVIKCAEKPATVTLTLNANSKDITFILLEAQA